MKNMEGAERDKYIRIRNAAIDLFDSQGIPNTSVSQITRRAGVAKGTFYLYFENREALERELLQYCMSLSLENSMKFVEDMPTYAEKLRQRTKNMLNYATRYPRESRIATYYYKPVNVVGTSGNPFEKSYEINREFLRLGIEAGEFKPLPLEIITQLFFSGVEGICTCFKENPEYYSREEVVELALDALIDLIAA